MNRYTINTFTCEFSRLMKIFMGSNVSFIMCRYYKCAWKFSENTLLIKGKNHPVTNSMADGTRKFNAKFTRTLK